MARGGPPAQQRIPKERIPPHPASRSGPTRGAMYRPVARSLTGIVGPRGSIEPPRSICISSHLISGDDVPGEGRGGGFRSHPAVVVVVVVVTAAAAELGLVPPEDLRLDHPVVLHRVGMEDHVLHPEGRSLRDPPGLLVVVDDPSHPLLDVRGELVQRNVVDPRLQKLLHRPRGVLRGGHHDHRLRQQSPLEAGGDVVPLDHDDRLVLEEVIDVGLVAEEGHPVEDLREAVLQPGQRRVDQR
mmetsp:Transcript_18636/g.43088  ORF Transcript_18636/g.43088 Transcript_18636/m.43088 type:complete len:242 (+) Transcript_18636:540-1265(+)